MKRQGLARKAVAAGLGIAMALGAVAPTMALAESTGNTNLYIESKTTDITTPEGAADENIKVVLPVAINYVADTQGNLTRLAVARLDREVVDGRAAPRRVLLVGDQVRVGPREVP